MRHEQAVFGLPAPARNGVPAGLRFTRIVAPIDGRVAALKVNVGDRVAPAPRGPALATIVSAETVDAGPGSEANGSVRLALVH